jgi:hypothetical protein
MVEAGNSACRAAFIPENGTGCAMPKFHFHIRDASGVVLDEDGMELPDLAAAREEAQEAARQLLADAIRAHKEVDGKKIEIAKDDGPVIEVIEVRDILNNPRPEH